MASVPHHKFRSCRLCSDNDRLGADAANDAKGHEEKFDRNPRGCLGCGREKFAISASVNAALAAVKATQSSPIMLVFRLTIKQPIARVYGLRLTIPKGAEGGPYSVNAARRRCGFDKTGVGGWDSLDTKAQRLLERLTSAT